MQGRTSIHKLFLPAGLLCLGIGVWGLFNYFHLKGPPVDQLHELRLQDVTQVNVESDIPGSTRIDNVWLETSNDGRIRYRSRFPYSDEILRRDTNYSLLLDGTNIVWAVKTGDGELHAQSYFEDYNIEAKDVGKLCGSVLTVFGALMLFVYFYTEYRFRSENVPPDPKLEVDSNRLRLVLVLLGYMVLFGEILGPWLLKYLPGFAVSLLWLASGGVLLSLFAKKSPSSSGRP